MSEKIRVLIVDDSSFFRHRISDILSAETDIEVVGFARNGLEAVQEVTKLNPDVVTMDVEMPVMDGITAVKRIMELHPSRILMFSNLTKEGAKETLQALEAGAVDFLPKQAESKLGGMLFDTAGNKLVSQVRMVARSKLPYSSQPLESKISSSSVRRMQHPSAATKLIAIGASTGGPVALQQILTSLPSDFPIPIVMAVHMPASFTPAYAERLNACSAIRVKEASHGDLLQPGMALLAPGGKQMLVEAGRGGMFVSVVDSLPEQSYHPSVDVLLGSAADAFQNSVLGIVLTGMGADGKQGARLLKSLGSTVWTQDEKSCVVYGMPQAVKKAGYSDRELPLSDIGPALGRLG